MATLLTLEKSLFPTISLSNFMVELKANLGVNHTQESSAGALVAQEPGIGRHISSFCLSSC